MENTNGFSPTSSKGIVSRASKSICQVKKLTPLGGSSCLVKVRRKKSPSSLKLKRKKRISIHSGPSTWIGPTTLSSSWPSSSSPFAICSITATRSTKHHDLHTLFHWIGSTFNFWCLLAVSRAGKCLLRSYDDSLYIFLAKVPLNILISSSIPSVNLLFSGLFFSAAVSSLFCIVCKTLLLPLTKEDGLRSLLSSTVLL